LTSPVLTSSQTSCASRPLRLMITPTRPRPSGVHRTRPIAPQHARSAFLGSFLRYLVDVAGDWPGLGWSSSEHRSATDETQRSAQ
jgi:hypothetical protein